MTGLLLVAALIGYVAAVLWHARIRWRVRRLWCAARRHCRKCVEDASQSQFCCRCGVRLRTYSEWTAAVDRRIGRPAGRGEGA